MYIERCKRKLYHSINDDPATGVAGDLQKGCKLIIIDRREETHLMNQSRQDDPTNTCIGELSKLSKSKR